jgi:hypothetical protein
MTRLTLLTIIVASFGAACTDPAGPTDPDNVPPEGSTIGSEEETYDHDNSGFDPWAVIDRLAKEGPARYTSRVHSCPKVRYATLGNVLRSFGVNTADTANLSPGQLYTQGANAMGEPNFANRIRENLTVSTSGASREFDIFAAAATTIINNVPANPRCAVGGANATLFNANNQCEPSGISCLIGAPATLSHLQFCNLTISSASTPDIGKRIAVAALMAAAYTCE